MYFSVCRIELCYKSNLAFSFFSNRKSSLSSQFFLESCHTKKILISILFITFGVKSSILFSHFFLNKYWLFPLFYGYENQICLIFSVCQKTTSHQQVNQISTKPISLITNAYWRRYAGERIRIQIDRIRPLSIHRIRIQINRILIRPFGKTGFISGFGSYQNTRTRNSDQYSWDADIRNDLMIFNNMIIYTNWIFSYSQNNLIVMKIR